MHAALGNTKQSFTLSAGWVSHNIRLISDSRLNWYPPTC